MATSRTVPTRDIDMPLSHYCGVEEDPCQVAGVAEQDRRYHRRGTPPVWYGCTSPEGLGHEFGRNRPTGVDLEEDFRLVADLNLASLMVLDVVAMVGAGALRTSEVTGDDFAVCHALADDALALGCGGLLVPAAGAPALTNVVVFPSHLGHLTVVHERIMTAAELLALVLSG